MFSAMYFHSGTSVIAFKNNDIKYKKSFWWRLGWVDLSRWRPIPVCSTPQGRMGDGEEILKLCKNKTLYFFIKKVKCHPCSCLSRNQYGIRPREGTITQIVIVIYGLRESSRICIDRLPGETVMPPFWLSQMSACFLPNGVYLLKLCTARGPTEFTGRW